MPPLARFEMSAVEQGGLTLPRRDAAEIYARLEVMLSAVILIWLLVGTYAPETVFRSITGTLPALASFTGLAMLLALRSGFRVPVTGRYLALYVLLAAGCLSVVLSYIEHVSLPGYPRAERFIIRQSYFLIMLPLAIMAGFVFWQRCYGALLRFCARFFVPLAIACMVSDWATAYLFGDPTFRGFNDYSKYADKGILTLLFSFVYLARVMSRCERHLLPLTLLLIYFGGTKILTYGSLFQATTGTIIMGILALVTVYRLRPALCAQLLVGFLGVVLAGLTVATVNPELLVDDANAYWRFSNWNSNFRALYDTGFVGIGFGTPYFPVTSDSLLHALNILQRGSEPWAGNTQTYDLIYLRTQHNSFVNLFFRTGLVGGLAFLLFNVGVLVAALRSMRGALPELQAQILLGLALVVLGLLQISLHVGLETPRFLVLYAFSIALSVLLSSAARNTG